MREAGRFREAKDEKPRGGCGSLLAFERALHCPELRLLDALEEMAELLFLRAQVVDGSLCGRHFDRHALDHL